MYQLRGAGLHNGGGVVTFNGGNLCDDTTLQAGLVTEAKAGPSETVTKA